MCLVVQKWFCAPQKSLLHLGESPTCNNFTNSPPKYCAPNKSPCTHTHPNKGPPYWMMYRGSHVGQLPRQGVCELSIGAQGGVPPPSSIHADDNNENKDNEDQGMVTQISHFTSRSACVPCVGALPRAPPPIPWLIWSVQVGRSSQF